jgi:alginate O-acetyltransferase complex protein AlgJ
MPKPPRTPLRTASDSLLVALFLLGICLPGLGLLFGAEPETRHWENRRYASAPQLEWNRKSLAHFPEQLEAYFNDRFGLRERLIRWDNLIRTAWLSTSPRPGSDKRLDGPGTETGSPNPWSTVLLGRDAWFYWFGGEMLEDYRGLYPFETGELDAWRCSFEERRRALERRGIPYLLVIAPEKHEVYPEYLPANLRRTTGKSRLDEFLAFMRAHSQLSILDLRAPLRAAKGTDALYYRTGTHWNEYGAYVADRAITERLATLLPGFSPVATPAFELRRRAVPGRHLLQTFGIADHFTDRTLELALVDAAGDPEWLVREETFVEFGSSTTRGSAPAGSPKAVVFHDSFARTHLGDFLSRHFERIEFRWTNRLDFALIDSLHPDVVIEEHASRFIVNLRPETSPGQAKCIRDGTRGGASMRLNPREP